MTEKCTSYLAKPHISTEQSGRWVVLRYIREATKNLN